MGFCYFLVLHRSIILLFTEVKIFGFNIFMVFFLHMKQWRIAGPLYSGAIELYLFVQPG